MMFQVPKSRVAGIDFGRTIASHLDALEKWRQHMANVARDPSTYQPYPAPIAPPMVAQALREERDGDGVLSYVPDYELVDDGPTPQQTLQSKKNHLFGTVFHMEQVAAATVFPPSRRRHIEFLVSDASAKKPEDRSAEEKALIQKYEETTAKLVQVSRHGAMLNNQIEDLTEETVETWKPADFPT